MADARIGKRGRALEDDPRQIYARPLIPVLLALMCGITFGFYVPGLPGLLPAVTAVFLASVLLAWKGRRVRFPPLLLFFLLGYCSLQGWIAPKLPANHVSRFIDKAPWHVIGTVESRPKRTDGSTRFVLRAESITRKQVSHPVTGPLQVTVKETLQDLEPGDRIAFLAKLKSIRSFNNPGGFDYESYMAFQGIKASAYVSKKELFIKLHAEKAGLLRGGLRRAQYGVSRLIDSASFQEPAAGGLLRALILGDRSEVSRDDQEAFNRIGVAHLLAISGLHIGMVASLAFFVFHYLLARSRRILLAAWATRGAAIMSAVPVLFYGLLAGMSPATQRAVIMVMVFLVALLFEREHDHVNTLAIAALIILMISPTALFQVSFQLSFVAVFAILYTLKHVPLAVRLQRGPHKTLKRPGLFFLVSAAAILGTLPITLYYFNQTSLIGLFANCLMVPLVGFLVVPTGLLAVLLSPLTPAGGLWIMQGAMSVMAWGLDLARFFSKCPFAAIKTVTPTLFEIGLYYFLAWTLFNFRKTRLAKIALVASIILASADGAYWAGRRFANDELRITFIDVGQGNAALLELPKGPCMLVDGGGFFDNRFDVGARIVAPLLWRKKIATIETLVLSHPDPDHLNGLLFIARHFNVKEVWMNEDDVPRETYREFLDITSENGIPVLGPKELMTRRRISGVDFEVLYPPADFLDRKHDDIWRTTNNNSLVLKATFKKVAFLFPGDIGGKAEEELTALAGSALKSDVLLVPHHGSRTSSTPTFLQSVDPAIAVVSVGHKSIFHLPHDTVIQRYSARGCRIFCTHSHGAVTVTTDGTRVRVEPFLSGRTQLPWSSA